MGNWCWSEYLVKVYYNRVEYNNAVDGDRIKNAFARVCFDVGCPGLVAALDINITFAIPFNTYAWGLRVRVSTMGY